MATKRIIWQQKTGASTSDILYPRTDWASIIDKPTIPDVSSFVKKTGDTMTGALRVYSAADGSESSISALGITLVNSGGEASLGALDGLRLIDSTKVVTFSTSGFAVQSPAGSVAKTINLPTSSGTLALKSDITWANIPDKPTIPTIPDLSRTVSGSGNAVTDIAVSGHKITVTKTQLATTATASTSSNGLMSSTDKSHLDSMWSVWASDGTTDTLVNKVQEVLAAFASFQEGDTIMGLLTNKADKTALNDYVTLGTEQTINASKTIADSYHILFEEGAAIAFPASDERGSNSISFSKFSNDAYVVFSFDDGLSLARCGGIDLDNGWGTDGQVLTSHGRDYPTWESLPTSLPPSGTAGGDLTGTYPSPTIGTGKVTEGKLATNAVTTAKIKDANVTNAKLDTTGITEGTYSVLTVNAQGRATAGANLFTVGTSTSIPSSVPTNGFYLQVVS